MLNVKETSTKFHVEKENTGHIHILSSLIKNELNLFK